MVVYSRTGKVLLLRRADRPGFWQSVTGSMTWEERDPRLTARRELAEETGLRVDEALKDWNRTFRFEIAEPWLPRFAPGTRVNVEHMFSLELVEEVEIRLNPDEHVELAWLDFEEALRRVSSWSNREAIALVRDAREASA